MDANLNISEANHSLWQNSHLCAGPIVIPPENLPQVTDLLEQMFVIAVSLKTQAECVPWKLTGIDFYQSLMVITNLKDQIQQAQIQVQAIKADGLQKIFYGVANELETGLVVMLEAMMTSRIQT